MGRPFNQELDRLASTYEYAVGLEISGLVRSIEATLSGGLLAVGSGGSFTAAEILRRLHRKATGITSAAMTPIELESLEFVSPNTVIWILSARGSNIDAIAAAESAIALEPAALISLTATERTPLKNRINRTPVGAAHFVESPAGRDGYLATNSLLATSVVLHRAYAAATGRETTMPSFTELVGGSVSATIEQFDKQYATLWCRDMVLVVHDAANAVGALDFESKATEAALGVIKPADIRNFAHGRHHWLTRFASRTAVLMWTGHEHLKLAQRTAELFPRDIAKAFVTSRLSTQFEDLESLVQAFCLTASIGAAKGVDPGRPGIAQFGSKLYGLSRRQKPAAVSSNEAAALRKVAAGALGSRDELRSLAMKAINVFDSTVISGLVCDLDGTLIPPSDRWLLTCRPELRVEFERLLANGMSIGIATGRAPTAKTLTLVRTLFDETRWDSIIIGCHNGALIRTLADVEVAHTDMSCSPLREIVAQLSPRLTGFLDRLVLDACPTQITLRASSTQRIIYPELLLDLAAEAIAASGISAKMTRSSHSVDIVLTSTSKTNVVDKLRARAAGEIVRFGDMGRWPGNDFELLASPLGLSVDRVSPDSATCWNLLPRGMRGLDGFLHYIRLLRPCGARRFQFDQAF